MPISKMQSDSVNLADDFAFTGTVTGAGGGKMLQVVTAQKTGATFDVTTSFSDVGLSATITPSSSSSKILVLHSSPCVALGSNDAIVILLRGSTTVYNFNMYSSASAWDACPTTFSYLDSPSTTSAITYKIQAKKAGGTFYYCYTNLVPTQATLTLLEIAG
jgi:hypothetical protein